MDTGGKRRCQDGMENTTLGKQGMEDPVWGVPVSLRKAK